MPRLGAAASRRRWLGALLGLVFVTSPLDSAMAAGELDLLVWPAPPAKARIRFVRELRQVSDVEPPRKRSFLERLIGVAETRTPKTMRAPAGLTTDARGRILVADSGRGLVFIFDLEAREVAYLGAGDGLRLRTPLDVAVGSDQRIYVADAGMQGLAVYGSDRRVLRVLTDPARLTNPAALALDEARDRLYVADSRGHRVVVIDLPSFQITDSFGERGEGPNRFNYPVGVAVDPTGRIYVSDTGSCTVKVFGPDYQQVGSFGGRGIAPSQFSRPKHVALDGHGHIYVVDALFDNFQVFSPERRLLLFVGAEGSRPGHFELPMGIHVDRRNRIYVSDQLNHRIQIFQFLGASESRN